MGDRLGVGGNLPALSRWRNRARSLGTGNMSVVQELSAVGLFFLFSTAGACNDDRAACDVASPVQAWSQPCDPHSSVRGGGKIWQGILPKGVPDIVLHALSAYCKSELGNSLIYTDLAEALKDWESS